MPAKKKKDEHRYPGVDTVPWKIRTADGKNPLTTKQGGEETFPSYSAAATAARRFTQETGEFAAPART